jgi:hypothetical protein
MTANYNIIFGFPIYQTKINPSQYDKDQIIQNISLNYERSSSRNNWNNKCDLHHSYNDTSNLDFVQLNYDSLIPVYQKEIQKFIDLLSLRKKIFWNFEIENYTATKHNQNMISHHHIPSVFSAVHYIKFDNQEHLPTVFENMSGYVDYLGVLYPNIMNILGDDISNSWIHSQYYPDVKEDDIIIFPSALRHHIEPSRSNTLRATIALNIFLNEDKND